MVILSDIGQYHGGPCAVTVGKFDGLHRGHIELLNILTKEAEKRGLKSVVLSFSPTPAEYFAKKNNYSLLTIIERESLLRRYDVNVDYWIVLPFDGDVAETSAEDFVEFLVKDRLDCQLVVAGAGFRFGNHGRGNVELLKKIGKKLEISVVAIEEKEHGSIGKIGSTNIRSQISAGNIVEANKCLGYWFFIMGVVVQGRMLGRTLGFPTLNVLPPAGKLLPPSGVYVTRTLLRERMFDSVTNIGNNPTVDGTHTTIETHLFDFDENAYGELIAVEFYEIIRGEVKFSTLAELKARIGADKERARIIHDNNSKFLQKT